MNTETVKGFKDYIGEEAEKRLAIQKILTEVFEDYGFEYAETPIIEQEEFVRGENPNDEAVSDIFKLKDKGERNLALRYEFTFQLKRIMNNKKLPYKRFQIGPVFRDEPTSTNRFRQFTQCDVDIVGSSTKEEAEILAIVQRVMKTLNIKFVIYVNNRKLLNEILNNAGIQRENFEAVIKIIDKLDKKPENEIKTELKPFRAEKVLEIFKQKEKYFEKYQAYSEIKELKNFCKLYDVKFEFQPSLARGLSYYNGNIFEVKTKEVKETINGGGSYFFNGIQCTGISFGLDRIMQLAKLSEQKTKILLISIGQDEKTLELAEKIRDNKTICSVMFGKISKALDYANSYNFNKVIFIGEEEVKKKKFKIKDMKTGKEEFLKEKELLEKIKP